VAVLQYTFTHKQYTEYRERNIHTIKRKKIWKCGPCPVFASYTQASVLQLRKKHGKTSVRVVEKCPDIAVAAVQYTFTHKQYTEQQNETEYTEWNIHNNNNS
jgi:quinolinate synthase